MDDVAALSRQDRADLFNESATRSGLPAGLLEKDFWVCWSLKQIFSMDELQGHLMFKGGTSLSKVFNAIHRFSEDVDLALGWKLVGIDADMTATGLSKTQQAKLWKEATSRCRTYIAGPLRSLLQERFSDVLRGSSAWTLSVDTEHLDNLTFEYPASGIQPVPYLKPSVVLELGTQAAFTPSETYTIQPMVAAHFPGLFVDATCPVRAIRLERTFWVKATILHREFHRPPAKSMSAGYSRHYYDLAMMASDPSIKAQVLDTLDLLAEVVSHKQLFYPQAWASYETAVPGRLRLVPGPGRIDALRADYAAMQVMMYPTSEPPSLDQIVEILRTLELDING